MGLADAEEFFRDVDVVKEKPPVAFLNARAEKGNLRNARMPRTFIKGLLIGILLSHLVWLAIFFFVRPGHV